MQETLLRFSFWPYLSIYIFLLFGVVLLILFDLTCFWCMVKVVDVDDVKWEVTIKLIPRLDLQHLAEKSAVKAVSSLFLFLAPQNFYMGNHDGVKILSPLVNIHDPH